MGQSLTKNIVLIALVAALSMITGCASYFMLDAAYRGKTSAVRKYLDRGADVNTKGMSGQTVLMHAARRCDTETVKLLIDRGADVKAKDNYGGTVLMHAAWGGHIETVKLLIDRGADIPSEVAILILPEHVYFKEIDGRSTAWGYPKGSRYPFIRLSPVIRLSPGVHNIKVTYYETGYTSPAPLDSTNGIISYKLIGKPISLSIYVQSGHFYVMQVKIDRATKIGRVRDRWRVWIEKWR